MKKEDHCLLQGGSCASDKTFVKHTDGFACSKRKIVKEECMTITNGSRCRESQLSIGLSSQSPVEEREE